MDKCFDFEFRASNIFYSAPNNFYSAMGQLNSIERRLRKGKTIGKQYEETIDTDLNAVYVRKLDQTELNKTLNNLQCLLPYHPVKKPH